MKLTIAINDKHAPEVLRFLLSLAERSAPLVNKPPGYVAPDEVERVTLDEVARAYGDLDESERFPVPGEVDPVSLATPRRSSPAFEGIDAAKMPEPEPDLDERKALGEALASPSPAESAAADLRAALDGPEPEAPALDTVAPEVGGRYKTRDGLDMVISGLIGSGSFPFEGSCEFGPMYYAADGKAINRSREWDLVERIADEPAPVEEAPAPVEVKTGGAPICFPAGLLEKLPPLPETPEGKVWKYEGKGSDECRQAPNIYAFEHGDEWSKSNCLTPLAAGHYAVLVDDVGF